MNKVFLALALASMMPFAANADVTGHYTTYAGSGAHVSYSPTAPNSNFGTPANTTDHSSYDIHLSSDSSYVYGLLQAAGDGPSGSPIVATFANLYFDIDSATRSGSDIGTGGADMFIPGVGGNVTVGDIKTYSADPLSFEFAIPVSYFNTMVSGLSYSSAVQIPADGGLVRLNLSQSFGYSVAGGQDFYGDTRLGTFEVPAAETAAVPEPAGWAMMVAGFGLIGGAVRRRRAAISLA